MTFLYIPGLINDDDHWVGGPATLVQTGDLIDRGPYSLEVLELFHKLRREAPDQVGAYLVFGVGVEGTHRVSWRAVRSSCRIPNVQIPGSFTLVM